MSTIQPHSRRPLDGPVIPFLSGRAAVAASDARWAAVVLAGRARDAAELRDWLQMAGLISALPYWAGRERCGSAEDDSSAGGRDD
jgi:hypothetical protein